MFYIMCTIFEYSLRALYTFLAIAAAVILLDVFAFCITGINESFVLAFIDMLIEVYGGVK